MKTKENAYGTYEVPENDEDIRELLLDTFGNIKQQAVNQISCEHAITLAELAKVIKNIYPKSV